MGLTIESLGDAAWMLRGFSFPPYEVVDAIAGVARVLEAASSYETVAVYFDPLFPPSEDEVLEACSRSAEGAAVGKSLVVPVCYELGEDLSDVAQALGLSVSEVVLSHTAQPFRCHAVGFRPGFPYLGWLPEALSGVPRRPQPRVRVPAGSVAIASRQTGIYPEEGPGGWAILGRTPLTLVDVGDDYFPIRAGDTVQFVSISEREFERRKGERL